MLWLVLKMECLVAFRYVGGVFVGEGGERNSQVVHDEMQKYTQETVIWKGGMDRV